MLKVSHRRLFGSRILLSEWLVLIFLFIDKTIRIFVARAELIGAESDIFFLSDLPIAISVDTFEDHWVCEFGRG